MKRPKEIIGFIQSIGDGNKLAQAWVSLNCQEWPKVFPKRYMPHWWKKTPLLLTDRDIRHRQHAWSILIMEYLQTRTSKYLINKVWMEHNDKVEKDA